MESIPTSQPAADLELAVEPPFTKEELAMLSPEIGKRLAAWTATAMDTAEVLARRKVMGETLSGAKEPAWVSVMRDLTYSLTLNDQDKLRQINDPLLDKAIVQATTLIAPFEK